MLPISRRTLSHSNAPFAFLSVIEEECTGNGTLASVLDGVSGRAVILPEPSDLGLLLSGVGVLWVDIEVRGAGGHAHVADRLETPVHALMRLISALDDLGHQSSHDYPDQQLTGVDQPYTVNIGRVECGDWRSSVASAGRLGVRVGFPRGWTADDALALVNGCVEKAMVGLGGDLLVTTEATGFRAEGYAINPDHELVRLVSACHEDAHGAPLERLVSGARLTPVTTSTSSGRRPFVMALWLATSMAPTKPSY